MRDSYKKQLEALHVSLIRMGAFCEEAIANAVKGLLDEDKGLAADVAQTEKDINLMEREIETFCLRLLLREQPVAGDLRQITAAQRIIADMERIGDQALDIAELSAFMVGSPVKSDIRIGDMAQATVKMLSDSVDSFVGSDLAKARSVIEYDDVVDNLFYKVKDELIVLIAKDGKNGGACLDLLMIAKYLERIGDHAANIAEWVEYSVTGNRRRD
ncbi:MAG: phosphate signaling complex protein PhoU [Clostridiales Family XIII bacterium]|jgi:phosphate transport system protein|nr:phosphate signaling complex protein PhoU [Clostridiales Family XIII bacterium]